MKTTLSGLFAFALLACLINTARAEKVADLAKQLKDQNPDVRRTAAKELQELGKDAKPATNALINSLQTDNDHFVRRFAAQALGAIGSDVSKLAVPALTAAVDAGLKDGRLELSEAAVDALGKMGPSAVPALSDVVKKAGGKKGDKGGKKDNTIDKEDALRQHAAKALVAMGKDAKAAVPVLADLLKDRVIRTDAAVALGNIGPDAKSSLDALKNAVGEKEKDKNFKKAVETAIKKIEGTPDKKK